MLELFIDVIFMENTEMWNKCPRENDLLKCIMVTHGCTGQTSILKVGGGGTTYIVPPNIENNNVFFPLLSQKLGGKCPQFLLHYRNSTCQVYSSQLEVAIAILSKSMFCHILKTCNQFYSKSHVNQLMLNTCICTHVHVYLNIWKVSFESAIKCLS